MTSLSEQHHTCITLKISSQNKCNSCTKWEERCIHLPPSKKQDSKCKRPWELKKDVDLKKAHGRTLKRICSSWNDIINAGILKHSDIPPNVRFAASKISHQFPSLPTPLQSNNHIEMSNNDHPNLNIRPTRRPTSNNKKK